MNHSLPFTCVRIIAALAVIALAGIARAAQTNAVDPRSFDAFKLVVERNIFDPNRRPPVKSDYRPPPKVVDTFSLTGTMSYENGTFAVFDGNNSDYHRVVGTGGKIAVYTVAAIDHDAVKLVSGTNEMELRVGMQCRRSEDGKWAPAEGGGSAYAFSSNSNYRSRNGGGGRERRNFGRNSYRGNNGNGPGSFTAPAMAPGGSAQPDEPPTGSAGADDVIARLMAARAAQLGGNPDQNQTDGPQADVNGPSGPGDNQGANQGNPNSNVNDQNGNTAEPAVNPGRVEPPTTEPTGTPNRLNP